MASPIRVHLTMQTLIMDRRIIRESTANGVAVRYVWARQARRCSSRTCASCPTTGFIWNRLIGMVPSNCVKRHNCDLYDAG